MEEKKQDVGYFVFSLDTELAWGYLWGQAQSKTNSRNGVKERDTILRLLNIMDEFGIVATWAITGHLFYEVCEECEICPVMSLKGVDARFDQIWGTKDPKWYGADVVDVLLSSGSGHEICFHGYSHKAFGRISDNDARFEIQEWLRLAKRKDIDCQTVIFPQGSIGHLDLFQEAGFICYRGNDVLHPAFSIPFFGKVLNRINLKLSIMTPQTFEVKYGPHGLVNIPSSQWLFRTDRRIETILDWLNLPHLRFHQTVKSIRTAAEEKKVVHLWAHPHEFRTEKDFEKLRYVFASYAEQAKTGRLRSITMMDLAKKFMEENQTI